jgi:glycosyltransferase involved in cell wall biosynthesis
MVLMNLPDPKKFQLRKNNRPEARKEPFGVVYFGTITRRLGVDLAIRAVGEIHKQHQAIQFHIFGDGEDREEFMELVQQLGLSDVVRFSEGAIPLDDLIGRVQNMDLLVVPNRKNAATELMLPVKMLEGIALGIPVVAPRLKTIDYYFTEDQVYYFEADDVASLTKGIGEALLDGEERERRAARAREFLEKYAWENHKMDLFQLYGSLLGREEKGP